MKMHFDLLSPTCTPATKGRRRTTAPPNPDYLGDYGRARRMKSPLSMLLTATTRLRAKYG
jgi:hypothetical protein